MAQKTIKENVEQGGFLGRIVERDDGKKVFLKGKKITPSTTAEETPTGDISGDQDAGTRTFNFHKALKSALSEGAGARKAAQFGAVQPFLSGGVGGMSSVTDFITKNAKVSATSTFESATAALKANIEETRQQREFNYDVLSDMAADGALETLPNSALESMARQAGISYESALAWKARVTETNKEAKEDRELKRQQIQADIEADRRRNTGDKGGDESSLGSPAEAAALALNSGDIQEYRLLRNQIPKNQLAEFDKAVERARISGEVEAKSEYFDDLRFRFQNLSGSDKEKEESLRQEIINDQSLSSEEKREAMEKLTSITGEEKLKGKPLSLTELGKLQDQGKEDFIFNTLFSNQVLGQG